jgi:hypothetical protein
MEPDSNFQDIGIILSFKTWIVFRVKIDSSAQIALTTEKNKFDGNMYEVDIGAFENTTSLIRYWYI